MRTHPTQNQPETNQMYRHTDENQSNNLFSIYHPVCFSRKSPVQNIPQTRIKDILVYFKYPGQSCEIKKNVE